MLACMMNDCHRSATRGQAWTVDPLEAIEHYQVGIKLELSIQDLAVRLVFCDEQARELTAAAWTALLSKLTGWGWQPLRGVNN
ncbi:hypothetical protein [Micromonospora avicenniae]|uniref:Uncharacterized protein n=1 Tax=Micromonospora avicenniae TaxID=1198245 RepID=A0A1N6ZAC1_9ACTN|nr:hypothetical protein [Micromonospora avicenniae]SIR23686.1 hypothetical protein SAMN05444858_107244 [Micromonospora avicenniae]